MSPRRSEDGRTAAIRMYRLGLGDSFLLRFSEGRRTRSVLIDCGVIGRSDAVEAVRQVVEDVAEATGGRLDVLVATHGHRDHASGFHDAADLFRKMEVGEVWLPATEDPGEAARAQRQERAKRLARLREVAEAHGDSPAAQGLVGVLGLFENCAADGANDAAAADLLEPLRSGPWPIRYLDAREPPRMLADLATVRIYVLGPPAGWAAGSAPATLNAGSAFVAAPFTPEEQLKWDRWWIGHGNVTAAAALSPEDEEWYAMLERNQPFEAAHRTRVAPRLEEISADPAEHRDFFQRYYAPDAAWRRIDHDWLGAARGLAVALDAQADAQSLALAFELTGSGQILLFPGDASAWSRWAGQSWQVAGSAGGQPRRITGADLLRRTAVLKVPHHCSSTAVRGALDHIEGRDLVALVTGDHAAAKVLQWDLPHRPSRDKLIRKTRGRVLFSDPAERRTEGSDGSHLTEPERRAFERTLRRTPLYLELTLRG